jgi:hypothetical protein
LSVLLSSPTNRKPKTLNMIVFILSFILVLEY